VPHSSRTSARGAGLDDPLLLVFQSYRPTVLGRHPEERFCDEGSLFDCVPNASVPPHKTSTGGAAHPFRRSRKSRQNCRWNKTGRELRLARGCVVILRRRRQFPDHKFLQQIRRRILANSNQRIFKNQIRPAILVRIIRIRNPARNQAPTNRRIIELPAPVVALAHHRHRHRVPYPRPHRSGSLVKISRVLLQQRRQNRSAEKCTGHEIRVRRPVTFCIPLRAFPVILEIILPLLHARNHAHHREIHRIDRRLPRQPEFLLGSQRRRVLHITHIKIRNHAQHPLLFLLLNLFRRHFHGGHHHPHLSRFGGQRQCNRRHRENFSRMQNPVRRLLRKRRRRNRHRERPRRHRRKRELSILAGHHLLFRRHISACQRHPRSHHGRARRIHHIPADASRRLRITLPLANGSHGSRRIGQSTRISWHRRRRRRRRLRLRRSRSKEPAKQNSQTRPRRALDAERRSPLGPSPRPPTPMFSSKLHAQYFIVSAHSPEDMTTISCFRLHPSQ